MQEIHLGHWHFICYFNAILGAHEKVGKCPLNKTYSNLFFHWCNDNKLVHLDTISRFYTYSNGRHGINHATN